MSLIMSGSELMKKLGLYQPTIDRPTGRWTPQEDAKLARLWAAGISISKISKTLRRRTDSVCKRRSELGLTARRRKAEA